MSYKEKLRKKYLHFRENLDPVFIGEASKKIKEKFLELEQIKKKDNIMVYVSYNSEVKTEDIIQKLLDRGKNVYVPYCITESRELRISQIRKFPADLRIGAYGIREPKEKLKEVNQSPEVLELIVVPGVAFSRSGYRIGYGGGYYDRFLSDIDSRPLTVGFTFSSLLVEALPIDRHDIPVDIIVTEEERVFCTEDLANRE